MGKIGCFLLIGFLLITLLGGMGCQNKTTATPEGTIKLFLDAHENLDVNKAAELFAKEDREKVQSHLSQLWAQQESVTYSEIEIEVISQTENTAKLRVQGEVTITGKDMPPQKLGVGDEYDLVKQDGKWLIKAPPDL